MRLLQNSLSVCLLFLLPLVGSARHIIGGEMYYVCNSSGNYTVTLKLYRDCASAGGAAFDSAPNSNTTGRVTIYIGDNDFDYRRIVLDAPVVTEIDLQTGNPCLDAPSNLCSETGVYTFDVDLPLIGESYHLVYQRCCRNPTINNLIDPSAAGSTYAVEITPTSQLTCNSSPEFKELPPAVICQDQILNYDHSAIDIDGDSLSYTFCNPFTGGTQNNPVPNPSLPPPWIELDFEFPYSYNDPMGGSPKVKMDADGLISGTPIIEGQYVVTVCCEEWRDGELIGKITREFQFNVTECIPIIKAQLQSTDVVDGLYRIETCNDLNIPFNDISFPSQNIESFSWELILSPDSTLTWDTKNNLVTLPSPGQYTGNLIINPNTQCSDTAFFEVVVTPSMDPLYEVVDDTCEPEIMSFNNSVLISSVDAIVWDFGDGNTGSGENPIHSYSAPGSYVVAMQLTDTLDCVETYQDTVRYYPIPEFWDILLDSMDNRLCAPAELFFSVDSDFLNDEYNITWSTGDKSTGTGYTYAHSYNLAGTFDVDVSILSPNGCTDSKNYPAFVELPFGIFLPNIINPNTTGENARFCVKSPCPLGNYALKIYDRYGSLVFQSEVEESCWDGTFNGKRVQQGVYPYILNFVDEKGRESTQVGDISVVY